MFSNKMRVRSNVLLKFSINKCKIRNLGFEFKLIYMYYMFCMYVFVIIKKRHHPMHYYDLCI